LIDEALVVMCRYNSQQYPHMVPSSLYGYSAQYRFDAIGYRRRRISKEEEELH
jgi:hypothetical protein